MRKATGAQLKIRAAVLMLLFLMGGFAVIIYQLFNLQIVRGEELQTRALQQQTRSLPLEAQRGMILDRNGKILAQSADVWNVCISPAEVERDTLQDMARDLAEILEIEVEHILDLASQRQFFYKRLRSRVEADIREEVLMLIAEKDYKGIFFEQSTRRYYRYGSLASTVLGFTNHDNQGAYGLEARYDRVLSGTPGLVVSSKNAWGADMPFMHTQRHDPKNGNSIVLTLDEAVQHFVERNLETAIIEHNIRNYAAGIVMDVNTGAIIAMAVKPDYDPNNPYVIANAAKAAILAELEAGSEEHTKLRSELWFDQWRNKAVSDVYEPGSTFKIITAAMGLDNNVVRTTDQFYCDGSIEVASETIRCHDRDGHQALDFKTGMARSCNPVFITVGQRIGGNSFYNYMNSFGFGAKTGIDLPGEEVGIIHSLQNLTKEGMVELSSSAFGQSHKMTPLQLIVALSATVNGGNLMQPYIVHQILDPDGNVIETTQPTVRRQVVSEATSAIVRDLVEGVVTVGSGRLAAIPGYRIGGKTGTSEKLDQEEGLNENILSFVGFVPMENPQYAVLVMLDGPKVENVYGSTIAAPVVGNIMQEMLPYLGLEPQYTQEQLEQREVDVPNLIGQNSLDARAILTGRGLNTRLIGSGGNVIRQIPQAFQKIPRGGTVILYTDDEAINRNIEVPDVIGMTAQEANRALVEAGLNIALRGILVDGVPTIVREQLPRAGSVATTGDVITLTLIRRPDEVLPAIPSLMN